MGRDGLLGRVRWGNLARCLALAGLAALVVAWPRLGGAPPRVPSAVAIPVAPLPPRRATPVPPRRAAPHRPRHHRRKRARKPAPALPPARKPTAAVTSPKPKPKPKPSPRSKPAPPVDPAVAEFGGP